MERAARTCGACVQQKRREGGSGERRRRSEARLSAFCAAVRMQRPRRSYLDATSLTSCELGGGPGRSCATQAAPLLRGKRYNSRLIAVQGEEGGGAAPGPAQRRATHMHGVRVHGGLLLTVAGLPR